MGACVQKILLLWAKTVKRVKGSLTFSCVAKLNRVPWNGIASDINQIYLSLLLNTHFWTDCWKLGLILKVIWSSFWWKALVFVGLLPTCYPWLLRQRLGDIFNNLLHNDVVVGFTFFIYLYFCGSNRMAVSSLTFFGAITC